MTEYARLCTGCSRYIPESEFKVEGSTEVWTQCRACRDRRAGRVDPLPDPGYWPKDKPFPAYPMQEIRCARCLETFTTGVIGYAPHECYRCATGLTEILRHQRRPVELPVWLL